MNEQKKVRLLSDEAVIDQLNLKDRALESTAEGITISDNTQPDNPIVYANRGFERLTGFSIEDVLGRNCRFLQGPGTALEAIEEIRDAVREQREVTVEILNYRKDGVPFWNRLSITPVRDAEGHATHFIGIQSDISVRKRAEDELRSTTRELELANQRMKKDLEDARQLQLTMLPDSLPELEQFDVAVRMTTAQEVGGDYYDCFQDQDGTLTLAIGDATGHGLKAGIVVTATKSMLNSLTQKTDPLKVLASTSVALKEMGFSNMFMALMLIKVSGRRLQLTSAGMPYPICYCAAKDCITEISLKGMPLGSFPEFPYQAEEIELQPGDTMLFLSDGLLELRDKSEQMFGEERTRELLVRSAGEKPDKIIDAFMDAAMDWSGGEDLRDDMTFLVMQAK